VPDKKKHKCSSQFLILELLPHTGACLIPIQESDRRKIIKILKIK
jgi:hypothetical protein